MAPKSKKNRSTIDVEKNIKKVVQKMHAGIPVKVPGWPLRINYNPGPQGTKDQTRPQDTPTTGTRPGGG